MRDTVSAWYPECNYNTHAARYLMARVTGSGSIDMEVRLMRYANWDDQVGELLDTRTDTWEIP